MIIYNVQNKTKTPWLELMYLCDMYTSATKNVETEPWNNDILCHELMNKK